MGSDYENDGGGTGALNWDPCAMEDRAARAFTSASAERANEHTKTLAERDALRARVAELERERDAAYERGRSDEHADAVAWCRRREATYVVRDPHSYVPMGGPQNAADAIERGEHVTGKRRSIAARTEWTIRAPTEPGWYWARGGYANERGEVVEVSHLPLRAALVAWQAGADGFGELGDIREWSGPIEPPR